MDKGYIMKNPMVEVLKPRSFKKNKKLRSLRLDEQEKFTDFLMAMKPENCKYKNVFLIQIYLVLRCSEALSLAIEDIDLKNQIVHVHTTLSIDEDGNIIRKDLTKTPAGDRFVQIPNFVLPHIKEQMIIGQCQENNEERLLFKPLDQKYTRRTNVNSELKRILKRNYKIDDISTHCLRHTFCTRCVESGMDPMVIPKLMGHTDIGLIFSVYAEVQEKFRNKEIEKINKYYITENLDKMNLIDELMNNPLGIYDLKPKEKIL